MKSLPVVFSPSARRDLLAIFDWVETTSQNSTTALRFTRRIAETCRRIGERPLTGAQRDDLTPGLRTTSFERKAVIAYMIQPTSVEITNIFYGGRDLEALYRER